MKREIVDRIHQIGAADLEWSFRGSPTFKTKGPTSSYAREHPVDPFPCYAHDPKLVAECVAMVEEFFPIAFQPDYYLPQYEETGRTNGFAQRDSIWDSKSGKTSGWEPYIVLIGKRIPPHPAMTRYLVAHEYGHVAQWWLEWIRGITDQTTTEMDFEYLKLRPNAHNDYGGGKWHGNVGELIANDFRIVVLGVEGEFWPHAGYDRPYDCPGVVDFWMKAVDDVKKASKAPDPRFGIIKEGWMQDA